MNEQNSRKLYKALLKDYDMGSYDQFVQDIQDEGKRRKLYDAIKGDYDLPDFDGFSNQLGIEVTTAPPSQPTTPAPTTAPNALKQQHPAASGGNKGTVLGGTGNIGNLTGAALGGAIGALQAGGQQNGSGTNDYQWSYNPPQPEPVKEQPVVQQNNGVPQQPAPTTSTTTTTTKKAEDDDAKTLEFIAAANKGGRDILRGVDQNGNHYSKEIKGNNITYYYDDKSVAQYVVDDNGNTKLKRYQYSNGDVDVHNDDGSVTKFETPHHYVFNPSGEVRMKSDAPFFIDPNLSKAWSRNKGSLPSYIDEYAGKSEAELHDVINKLSEQSYMYDSNSAEYADLAARQNSAALQLVAKQCGFANLAEAEKNPGKFDYERFKFFVATNYPCALTDKLMDGSIQYEPMPNVWHGALIASELMSDDILNNKLQGGDYYINSAMLSNKEELGKFYSLCLGEALRTGQRVDGIIKREWDKISMKINENAELAVDGYLQKWIDDTPKWLLYTGYALSNSITGGAGANIATSNPIDRHQVDLLFNKYQNTLSGGAKLGADVIGLVADLPLYMLASEGAGALIGPEALAASGGARVLQSTLTMTGVGLVGQGVQDWHAGEFSGVGQWLSTSTSSAATGATLGVFGEAARGVALRPTSKAAVLFNKGVEYTFETAGFTLPEWVSTVYNGVTPEGDPITGDYFWHSAVHNLGVVVAMKGRRNFKNWKPVVNKGDLTQLQSTYPDLYDNLTHNLDMVTRGKPVDELSDAARKQLAQLQDDMNTPGKGVSWTTYKKTMNLFGFEVVPPRPSSVRVEGNVVQVLDSGGNVITEKKYANTKAATQERDKLHSQIEHDTERVNAQRYDASRREKLYYDTCSDIADRMSDNKEWRKRGEDGNFLVDENGNYIPDENYRCVTPEDVDAALKEAYQTPEGERTADQVQLITIFEAAAKQMSNSVPTVRDLAQMVCDIYGISVDQLERASNLEPSSRRKGDKTTQAMALFNDLLNRGVTTSGKPVGRVKLKHAETGDAFIEVYNEANPANKDGYYFYKDATGQTRWLPANEVESYEPIMNESEQRYKVSNDNAKATLDRIIDTYTKEASLYNDELLDMRINNILEKYDLKLDEEGNILRKEGAKRGEADIDENGMRTGDADLLKLQTFLKVRQDRAAAKQGEDNMRNLRSERERAEAVAAWGQENGVTYDVDYLVEHPLELDELIKKMNSGETAEPGAASVVDEGTGTTDEPAGDTGVITDDMLPSIEETVDWMFPNASEADRTAYIDHYTKHPEEIEKSRKNFAIMRSHQQPQSDAKVDSETTTGDTTKTAPTSIEAGGRYNIVDEQGAQHEVEVLRDNGNGTLEVRVDGAEDSMPMAKDQLAAMLGVDVALPTQQTEPPVTTTKLEQPAPVATNEMKEADVDAGESGVSLRDKAAAYVDAYFPDVKGDEREGFIEQLVAQNDFENTIRFDKEDGVNLDRVAKYEQRIAELEKERAATNSKEASDDSGEAVEPYRIDEAADPDAIAEAGFSEDNLAATADYLNGKIDERAYLERLGFDKDVLAGIDDDKVSKWVEGVANRASEFLTDKPVESGDVRVESDEVPADAEVEATTEPMPLFDDGNPNYAGTTPERGRQYIYDESGLDKGEADAYVSANLASAEKDLDKIKKKPPKMGTNLVKYQKDKADWESRMQEAQSNVDYWNKVKASQADYEAEQAKARKAADAEVRAQAVVDEQARQAAELAKQQEQAERGAGAVHPAIAEKWNNAPKIEGYKDEVVLANGERVPGTYYLVESGAVTPSHNASREFEKYEGFPVDENGNTINDRDYERDKDAQNITRSIADNYDSRALQTPVIVSKDGVVLSGNGRTMAGELAASNNTDGAYIEHLKNYGRKYGFSPEQVDGMQHPRAVFVPDADMPYTTETFAKFNAQEMKGQSKTEQAVKLGKVVDDATFNQVVRAINEHETLGDFYGDTKAATEAINALRRAGAINDMQYAEMFDGDAVSDRGRQIIENMLIGKAFEGNPDVIRQLTEIKSLRQSVVTALNEITTNVALGKEYSLEKELAQAIELAYKARKAGYKENEPVSPYARQLNLFPFEDGETVADYNNAAVLMLADLMNDKRPTLLKKKLQDYNQQSAESAAGQMDIFAGGVKEKKEIIKTVLNTLHNGETEETSRPEQRGPVADERGGEANLQEDGAAGQPEQGESNIQGLESYSEDELRVIVDEHVRSAIADADMDAEITGIRFIGSRTTGTARADSDLDVLVEYQGTAREDSLFNVLNDEDNRLVIDGITVDINPITPGKSGTIEEFMKRNAGYKKETTVQEQIALAEQQTETTPSEAQKEAGNYKKGHVKIDGFDISIEQPKGSVRSGVDATGKAWSQKMNNTYGYIRGTEGVDGDHIDVFLSDDPSQGDVFVVDQVNNDGSFDEHKVMYGFNSEEEARQAYLSNYEDGWQGLGAITAVSKDEFKKWIGSSHRKTKPFAEYKNVKVEGEQADALRQPTGQTVDGDIARFHKETDSSGRTAIDEANYNADDLVAPLLVDGKKSHIGITHIVPDDINEPTYTRAYYDYAHLIDPKTNKGWQAVGDKIDEWNASHKKDEQGFDDGDAPQVRFPSVDAALKFAEWFEGATHPVSAAKSSQKSEVAEAPKERIDDVGEKIEGAKKDLAQKMGERINLDADTFPKMFPKYDLKQLISQGLDPSLAVMTKMLRQMAQADYKHYSKKRMYGKNYALRAARFYAAYAKQVLEAGDSNVDFKSEGLGFTDYGKQFVELNKRLFEELHKKLGDDIFDLDLTGVKMQPISQKEGTTWYRRNQETGESEPYNPAYAFIGPRGQSYYEANELDKALQEGVEQVSKSIDYKKTHPYKLGHYYKPGVKNSDYVGVKLGGKVVPLTEPMTSSEVRKYMSEHNAELQAKAAQLDEQRKLDKKKGGTGEGRWKPELTLGGGRPRVGADRRGGVDIEAEEFMKSFGFRGVQFGNYVTQRERQRFLNEAYDALMDMAELLGISPRALAIDGRLGLAIGARGGGKANAHYEPKENVINLTKSKGAGSLAHEWFHALDYYFNKSSNIPTSATSNKSAEQFPASTRDEMRKAFLDLMRAIKNSDYYNRSVALEQKLHPQQLGEGYYDKPTELGARAFQDYVVRKLTDQGKINDFLSSFTSEKDWNGEPENYPYPVGAEAEKIDEKFDALFDAMQERTDEQGNTILYHLGKDNDVLTDTEVALRDGLVDVLRGAGIDVVTDEAEGQRVLDAANRAADVLDEIKKRNQQQETALPEDESSFKGTAISSADGAKVIKNLESGINALKKIAEGAESVPNAMTREDLSQYGGDNHITFIFGKTGDPSRSYKGGYGIAHIGGKHGADTLLHVLNVIAKGKIDRYVRGNKTVVLSDGKYEVVLGLTRYGNKETWLFNGWRKEEKTGADGEVSTHSDATQANPTFSREDLGAVLSDAKIQQIVDTSKDLPGKIREMRAWHGSGADFDAFDHGHMGEGEGAQAYGWGTYVTQVEGIARSYAEVNAKKPPYLSVAKRHRNTAYENFINSRNAVESCKRGIENYEKRITANKEYIEELEDSRAYILKEHGESSVELENWDFLGQKMLSQVREEIEADKNRIASSREYLRNLEKMLPYLESEYEKAKAEVLRLDAMTKRYLYEVEIPDNDGTNYLSWDEPLTDEQLERIALAGRQSKEFAENFDLRNDPLAWAKVNEKSRRGDNVYSTLSNMLGARKASELLSQAGFVGIEYPAQYRSGGRDDGAKNYVIFDEGDLKINSKAQFFRTGSGEVYGFVSDGKIYIDPRVASAETPVHEYSHLWADALKRANPEAWERLKETMLGEKDVLEHVKRLYPELEGDELLAEVFSHYSGKRGAERLRADMEREVKNAEGVFAKARVARVFDIIRRALSRFWEMARDLFAGKNSMLNGMRAEDFADMAMADMLRGFDPHGVEKEIALNETHYHKVADKAELERLNNEPTVVRYRAMQMIDGKLYPPMSAEVKGELREPTEIGVWERSDERPDLVDKNGKFKLQKGKRFKENKEGQGDTPAAYNPYFHTSTSMMNDQFTAAYVRPELVVVKVEIPESELSSGYKAEKAKDAVGNIPWHSGPVNSALPKERQRTVTLSRYCKVTEVVPDAEVAEAIAKQLEGLDVEVPYNVVTPNVRAELEARGVKISATPSGSVTRDINGELINRGEAMVANEREVLYEPQARTTRPANKDALESVAERTKGERGSSIVFERGSSYRNGNGDVIRFESHAEQLNLFGTPQSGALRQHDISGKPTARNERVKRASEMSDAELLSEMGRDIAEFEKLGRGDWGLQTACTDEYDRRHVKEYNAECERVRTMLDENNVSIEEAEDMLCNAIYSWRDGFATADRSKLLAQFDTLNDYYAEKEDERDNADLYQEVESEQAISEADARNTETPTQQEVAPTTQQTEPAKPKKAAFDPSAIKLRKLKSGETCHVERRYQESGVFDFTGSEKVESDADLAYIFRNLENSAIENTFLVLIKNGKATILHVGMGGYAFSAGHLGAGVLAASQLKPDSVIFVHNHPSGTLQPSQQDVAMQEKVKKMFGADKVREAIIIDITSGKYSIFDSDGLGAKEKQRPTSAENEVPYKTYSFSQQVFAEGFVPGSTFQITDSDKAAEFISGHRLGERDKLSLIVLNRQKRVTGNIFLPWTSLDGVDVNKAAGIIAKFIHQMGGESGILYGSGTISRGTLSPLARAISNYEVHLDDFISVEGKSAFQAGAMEEGVEYQPTAGNTGLANEDSVPYDDSGISDEELAGYDAGRYSFAESITQGLVDLATKNADDQQLRMNAMREFGGNLAKLQKLMNKQKAYDKATVDDIVRLTRMVMGNGFFKDMRASEVKRLLAAIKKGVGAEDLTPIANNVVDMLVQHQLRESKNMLHKLMQVRGRKVDARGVEVQAGLDIDGQRMMSALKDGMSLGENGLLTRINDCENRLGSEDEVIRKNAMSEYQGLMLAKEYHDNILSGEEEEIVLRNEKRQEQEKIYDFRREPVLDDDGNAIMNLDGSVRTVERKTLKPEFKGAMTDENKRLRRNTEAAIERIEQSIRENRMERVTSYIDFMSDVAGDVRASRERAAEWRAEQQQRVDEIHHNANSDLEGVPVQSQVKLPEGGLLAFNSNNDIVRLLFQPLATFEKMLRFFGRKAHNGEGYLFNRFMRGWVDCSDKEWRSKRAAHEELDAKVNELFGKKAKRWSDLYKVERNKKHPGIPVEYWDNGERVQETMSQGEALSLVVWSKQKDAEAGLRRMGISEEDIETIKNNLDPKFLQLAEWVVEEFLPKRREYYNEVHERMFGAPMAAIEHYFPIVRNSRDVEKPSDITERDLGETKPSTITGNIIKRQRTAATLDVHTDFFDHLLKHLDDMENWAAWAEFNRDINTLRNYKRFKNRVLNMHSVEYGSGKDLWKAFDDACAIAAGVYHPSTKRGSGDNLAVNIAKGVTGAKIAFRFYTAAKQLLSLPAFWNGDAGLKELAKWENPVGAIIAWNWAMKNLPGFSKRWQSRQVGDVRLMDTDSDYAFWRNNMVRALRRGGMWANALVDGMTVAMGARAVYETKKKRYLRNGYSEEQAEKRAMQDAAISYNSSQQSSEDAFLSSLQLDRTWWSTLMTVFRSASMGYQRRLTTGLRNLKNRTKKGYKAESIAFMKKQMERDGVDEATAEKAAKRTYRCGGLRSMADVFVYGFVLPFFWNLGPYALYLLMGDDDDEKKDMLKDASVHSLFGPIEGLTGGNAMSEIGNTYAGYLMSDNDKSLLNALRYHDYLSMPLGSDLQQIFNEAGNDSMAAWTDAFNLLVQAGIGINPETFTDTWVAIADACEGDPQTTKEFALCFMRVMQVPQTQTDKLFIDELGMTAKDAQKLNAMEMADRFARYKKFRNAPLLNWAYSPDESQKVAEKYRKRFLDNMQERMEHMDDEQLGWNFENPNDSERRKAVGKVYAKGKGVQDSAGKKPASNWKPETRRSQLKYHRLRDYNDLAEDVLLDVAIDQAKNRGDHETEKALRDAKKELTEIKRGKHTKTIDINGLGDGSADDDKAIMEELRARRKEILREHGVI